MNNRILAVILVSIAIIAALSAAIYGAATSAKPQVIATALENVRDFSPALDPKHDNYAVAGGVLFSGRPSMWRQIKTPRAVIVNAVATDRANPDIVYIGAANRISIYRSVDAGESWTEIPLSDEVGGVTDIAVDSVQRLIYVGSDAGHVFRLRDVGSSLILGGQLLLEAPVLQVAADTAGGGMAFARTKWALYRAENFGLRWSEVDDLGSAPTAVIMSGADHASVYVGTVDRGVLTSQDGRTWTPVNAGLDLAPGSRLQVDALAADPAQPDVLYASLSYLFGSTTLHQTPAAVMMSENAGAAWSTLETDIQDPVVSLMPLTGHTGAVFALTTRNPSPVAIGSAVAEPIASTLVSEEPDTHTPSPASDTLTWVLASLAALALFLAAANDIFSASPLFTSRPVTSN